MSREHFVKSRTDTNENSLDPITISFSRCPSSSFSTPFFTSRSRSSCHSNNSIARFLPIQRFLSQHPLDVSRFSNALLVWWKSIGWSTRFSELASSLTAEILVLLPPEEIETGLSLELSSCQIAEGAPARESFPRAGWWHNARRCYSCSREDSHAETRYSLNAGPVLSAAGETDVSSFTIVVDHSHPRRIAIFRVCRHAIAETYATPANSRW